MNLKTRTIVCFVIVSYALAWLACLPAWFTGGLMSPYFGICAQAMMFAPAIAAVGALRWSEGWPLRTVDQDNPGILIRLGFAPHRSTTGTPVKIPRWIGWIVLAWALLAVCVVAAYLLSALFGVWVPDLVNFSVLAETFSAQGLPMDAMPPIGVLAALQLVQAATLGVLITCVFTTGEELGWRGLLYPALFARFPRPVALVIGGLVWGLWHAPVILLGYNYGDPVLGLPMMCGFTILYGAVLAWLTTRSGSIWPAVVGHAMVNTASSAILLTLSDVTVEPSPILGTPLGLIGWIVPAVVAVVLWLFFARRSAAPAPGA